MAWPAGSEISESTHESKAVEAVQWFNDPDIIALAEDVYLICKKLAESQHYATLESPSSVAALTLSASTFNGPQSPPNANDVAGTANGMKTLTGTEADATKPHAPIGFDLNDELLILTSSPS